MSIHCDPDALRQFSERMREWAEATRAMIQRYLVQVAADAEQIRRDRDDELDWLGGYRGRRG